MAYSRNDSNYLFSEGVISAVVEPRKKQVETEIAAFTDDDSTRIEAMAAEDRWYRADWTFEDLPPNRRDALIGAPNYDKIINRIADRAVVARIEFALDEGWVSPVNGAIRPLFWIDVGEDLADIFFNGITGYRAQYYRSAARGLVANRYALSIFEEKLVACARAHDFRAPDPNAQGQYLVTSETALVKSLRLPSAKIWGDEPETELGRVARERQDTVAQIVAPRWLDAAITGEEKARKGIKAPRFRRLKFHGAFLIDEEERIAPNKLFRSEDLFRWGFS